MGKVQYGGGVLAINGSINGWTFQSNRSGAIIRSRGGTLKNPTAKQTEAHQLVTSFHQFWQTLTSAQKATWDAFALAHDRTDRYGTVKTLTGINWASSLNFYRTLLGQGLLTSAPAYDLPTAVQDYNYAVRSFDILLNFSPAFNPADNSLLIFTTPITSRTTISLRKNMRLTKTIVNGPFGFIDLTSDWETTHGISWPPSLFPICGYIGIMVQTIRKSSGISSPALIKTNNTTTGLEGIGYMSIGNDFIVKELYPFDPDARIYFDAVKAAGGTLSQNLKVALNTYIVDAKTNPFAWWNDSVGIYPLRGLIKNAQKINMKDPTTFPLAFVNTVAADFDKYGWNSTNTSYARTGIVSGVDVPVNTVHCELYSNTPGWASAVGKTDFGIRSGATSSFRIFGIRSSGSAFATFGAGFAINVVVPDGTDNFICRIDGVNTLRAFRNGLSIDSANNTAMAASPFDFYFGARNQAGAAGSITTRFYRFLACGDALTNDQALARSNATALLLQSF